MRKFVNSYKNTDYDKGSKYLRSLDILRNTFNVVTCYNINEILYNEKNFATYKFKLKSISSGFVAGR